jgi:hypothetical protein
VRQETTRFFEKNCGKKLLQLFTQDVSTSPGGKLSKVFGAPFFKKAHSS